MKILIVDDVAFMLTSLKQLLQRHGYDVLARTSAEEALEVLAIDFTIEVVITDFMMPDVNGVEFCRRAQTIERYNDDGPVPPPPFIMLTSFERTSRSANLATDFSDAQQLFEAVLPKPVEPDELLRVIQQIEQSSTSAGRATTKVRWLLQQAQESLAQIRSHGEVFHTVEQLQSQLAGFLQEAGKGE